MTEYTVPAISRIWLPAAALLVAAVSLGCGRGEDGSAGKALVDEAAPSADLQAMPGEDAPTAERHQSVKLSDQQPYKISPGEVGTRPGSIAWTLHDQQEFRGSATIDKKGFVYVGNESGRLFKLDPRSGEPQWIFNCCEDQPTPEFDERRGGQLCNVDSTPAIDLDGNVWVGCWNGTLAKLDSEGQLLCRAFALDEFSSSPAVDLDGSIYMGSEDRVLWAIDGDDCSAKWKHEFPDGAVYGAPAITAQGTIVTTSADDNVYAWNRAGEKLWQFSTGFDVYSSVAVGQDGTLYVGSGDHNLYALSPNGMEQWRFTARDRIDSSAAVAADGTIYTGSWDGNVYALTADGSLRWAFATNDEIWSSPALGHDGTVYIGSNDDHLYALRPDGSLLWKTRLDGDIFASATVGDDGTVYIGTHGGTFYAIRSSSKGLADAPWPQFKGKRLRRAHACDSLAANCPCSDEDDCGGGDPCALEVCNGKDDNCDGRSDEGACPPACSGQNCSDGPTFTSSCSATGSCIRRCRSGFEGKDCDRPIRSVKGGVGSIAWVKTTGANIQAPATVAKDGSIYIGSGDYHLYHLDPQGRQLCRYRTEYHVDAPAQELANGQIWFGSNDQVLHGIDANCKPICSQEDEVPVTDGSITGKLVEAEDSSVLFTSGDGNLYRAWPSKCLAEVELSLGGTMYGGPTQGDDGLIYIASYAGTLQAWDPVSRAVRWSLDGLGSVRAAIAVSADGRRLFVASRDRGLIAVQAADGKVLWELELGDELWARPTIGVQGRIYLGSYDGTVHAISSSGKRLWDFATGGSIVSSIALDESGDKALYVGSGDGKIYALSMNGKLLWSAGVGSPIGASGPALTADGLVLVGTQAGNLVAIRRTAGNDGSVGAEAAPGDDDSAVDEVVDGPPTVPPGGIAPPIGLPTGGGAESDSIPDPAGGGGVEPPTDPGQGINPSTDSKLSAVAALMIGSRFRWVQGTHDVATGFYGSPLLFNLWSCSDKKVDETLSWLLSLEDVYADNMVGVLVPANVAERNLSGQDNMCGSSVLMARSHGVDVDKAVLHELGPKTMPATYVFDAEGRVLASHFGPVVSGSKQAAKLMAAFKAEMAPLLKARRDSALEGSIR